MGGEDSSKEERGKDGEVNRMRANSWREREREIHKCESEAFYRGNKLEMVLAGKWLELYLGKGSAKGCM